MSKRILYNITSASLQATNISGGTISGTTFTGGSLSLSGNLNVAGTLTTVNITSTNLVNTNISSGTVSATTFTGGSLSLSGNLNVAGTLTTVNITSTNLVNTNVSAGLVVASTSLSATGNSNTIGNIFTTAGNVGIGTSAPGERLDVRGNLRIGSSTQGNYISFYGTFQDGPDHTYIGERLYGGTESSELLLFKGNDISGGPGPDRIRLLSANHLFDTYTSELSGTFAGVGTSGTTRMLIDQNGNVGVGTTSPAYKLDVNGVTRINTTRGVLIGSSTDIDAHRLISALDSGMPGNSDRYIAFGKAASNNNQAELAFFNVTTGSSSNYLGLGLYGGRTMAINGAGNVGIGTTAPSGTLSIVGPGSAGTIRIYPNTPRTETNISFHESSTDGNNLWFIGQGAYSNGTNFCIGQTGFGGPMMVFTTAGNVGIGTSSPETKLHVSGTARITTSVTTGALYSTNQTSTNIVGTNISSGTLNLSTGLTSANARITNISTNSIIIDNSNSSNGIQVGVGTGSTTSNLNLYGAFTDGYAIIQAGSTNNNSPNLKIVRNNTPGGTIANFQVYSQTSAFIGGSVGIGTTSPSYPLHVVGQVGGEGSWATSYYYHVSSNQGGQYIGWIPDQGAVYTIRANGRMAASAFDAFSDIRIKKNIQDVDDVSALDTLRLIQPKLYNYIDEGLRGTERVWGFIAQQVKSVMNYAVNTSEEFVPDIFSLCTVGNLNQSTSTLILSSPSDITVDTKLRLIMETGDYKDVIVKTVAENLLTVDCKIEQEKVFVYGKNVTDFHTLNKDAIFTVAVAALQEVDRELQTEKQEHTQTKQQLQILSSKMDSLIQKLNGKYPGEFEL